MPIVVVEELNGQPHIERAFDTPVVSVGRDRTECEIVFESEKWPMVSRKHAEFRVDGSRCLLVDNGSRYGTFLDGRQISGPTEVKPGARAQFGTGGPVLRIIRIDPVQSANAPEQKPLVRQPTIAHPVRTQPQPAQQQFQRTDGQQLHFHQLSEGQTLSIGRAAENNIRLDGLQISNNHARATRIQGAIFIEDTGSTNGVYVNGTRITNKTPISERDAVQIGPFLLVVDPAAGLAISDTRAKTRIAASGITK